MSNPDILFDNILEETTLLSASTVDASDTSFNVLHVIDKRPYTFWQSGTSTGVKFITIDTQNTTASADALGIVGHNLSEAGASIAVQHSSDDFIAITTVATATPVNHFAFETTFPSTINRFWRIAINQPTTVKVKIGVAVLGDRLQFTRQQGKNINPDTHQVVSDGQDSKVLHPLGVNYRGSRRNPTISLTGVPATFIADTFLPFWSSHMKRSEPFFWRWNPSVEATSVHYMQLVPNSAFVSNYINDMNDFRDLQFTLKGRLEE